MKVSLDKAEITSQDQALRQAAGQAFYNTSNFTLRDLKARGPASSSSWPTSSSATRFRVSPKPTPSGR
jgi:hypothetical protein